MEHGNGIVLLGSILMLFSGLYSVHSGKKMRKGGVENLPHFDRLVLVIGSKLGNRKYESLRLELTNDKRMKKKGLEYIIYGFLFLVAVLVVWVLMIV